MTPSEIITQEAQSHGKDPKILMHWINEHVRAHNAILLQHGDSVMMLKKIAPHQVELHLFTQDKPIALVGAVKDFYERIKKSGVRRVYGKADDPQVLKLAKIGGFNVVNSDRPQFNWMANVED